MREPPTPFLQRLRRLRKNSGVSQEEISRHLGLNQATYSAMERGRQKIFAEYLPKIAEAIKVPIWELFVDPEETEALDEQGRRLFSMWKHFDPAEKNVISAMAEQIGEKKDMECHDPAMDADATVPKVKKGKKDKLAKTG